MVEFNEVVAYVGGALSSLVGLGPWIHRIAKRAEAYTKEGTRVDRVLDMLILVGDEIDELKSDPKLKEAIGVSRLLSVARKENKHSPRKHYRPGE